MVEETLEEVQRIADLRNESAMGAEMQNPERLGFFLFFYCYESSDSFESVESPTMNLTESELVSKFQIEIVGNGAVNQSTILRMVCAVVMWTFVAWKKPDGLMAGWLMDVGW